MILWNKCKICKTFHVELLTLRTKNCRSFLLWRSLIPYSTNANKYSNSKFTSLSLFFFCSALGPSSLAKAIYPVLVSYSSPDKQAFPRHTLSRAALIMSESPIFLLDTFTNLIVYYSSTADPSIPFPPPRDCKYMVLHFVVHVLSSTYMLSKRKELHKAPKNIVWCSGG